MRSAWTDRVARDSGLYRTDPAVSATQHDIQYSTAAFHAPRYDHLDRLQRRRHRPQIRRSSYSGSFGVGTQAADGMRLDRSYGTSGIALSDLDSPEAISTSRPSR